MAARLDYETALCVGDCEELEITLSNGKEISGIFFDGIVLTWLPKGRRDYFIRHDDGDAGEPIGIKKDKSLTVNFMGTFVTRKAIPFGRSKELKIIDWNWL